MPTSITWDKLQCFNVYWANYNCFEIKFYMKWTDLKSLFVWQCFLIGSIKHGFRIIILAAARQRITFAVQFCFFFKSYHHRWNGTFARKDIETNRWWWTKALLLFAILSSGLINHFYMGNHFLVSIWMLYIRTHMKYSHFKCSYCLLTRIAIDEIETLQKLSLLGVHFFSHKQYEYPICLCALLELRNTCPQFSYHSNNVNISGFIFYLIAFRRKLDIKYGIPRISGHSLEWNYHAFRDYGGRKLEMLNVSWQNSLSMPLSLSTDDLQNSHLDLMENIFQLNCDSETLTQLKLNDWHFFLL